MPSSASKDDTSPALQYGPDAMRDGVHSTRRSPAGKPACEFGSDTSCGGAVAARPLSFPSPMPVMDVISERSRSGSRPAAARSHRRGCEADRRSTAECQHVGPSGDDSARVAHDVPGTCGPDHRSGSGWLEQRDDRRARCLPGRRTAVDASQRVASRPGQPVVPAPNTMRTQACHTRKRILLVTGAGLGAGDAPARCVPRAHATRHVPGRRRSVSVMSLAQRSRRRLPHPGPRSRPGALVTASVAGRGIGHEYAEVRTAGQPTEVTKSSARRTLRRCRSMMMTTRGGGDLRCTARAGRRTLMVGRPDHGGIKRPPGRSAPPRGSPRLCGPPAASRRTPPERRPRRQPFRRVRHRRWRAEGRRA